MNMLSLDSAYGTGTMEEMQDTPARGSSGGGMYSADMPSPHMPSPHMPSPHMPSPHMPSPHMPSHASMPTPRTSMPSPHHGTGMPYASGTGRPRRQVRFVNDGADTPYHKYARVETNEAPTPTWLEKNKVLVMAVAATTLVVLIIVFVVVLRGKRPAQAVPFMGNGIPAYVGGHGWESASNYGYGAPAQVPQA